MKIGRKSLQQTTKEKERKGIKGRLKLIVLQKREDLRKAFCREMPAKRK